MSRDLIEARSSKVVARDSQKADDHSLDAPWLALVAEKVKTLNYGVIQIVVHDSRVVQVERTERFRFDVPR